jgi:hypothetical protein
VTLRGALEGKEKKEKEKKEMKNTEDSMGIEIHHTGRIY